jgi:hypothetical protein
MERVGLRTYVVVGRSSDCDVVLDDVAVSSRHARLRWDGDRIAIEDLGSANGTFVDGRMIHDATIRPGDEVVLGSVPLPWSDARMRSFLRSSPRRSTLRSLTLRGRAMWGRRFVCGACHTRGLLPPGFTSGELLCSACGAHLVLGAARARGPWAPAFLGAGAVIAGVLTAVAVMLAPARAHTAWVRIERAFGFAGQPNEPAASSPEEASIRSRIASRVAGAIDPGDAITRNLAVRLAASADGPFHVEQVARLWTHVRQNWHYVSDPRGGKYFARASETIENGMAGDCDDFATVLIAMIHAIGGQARMVMVDGDDGGHAYAEVCIGGDPHDVAESLAAFYRAGAVSEVPALRDIHFRSDAECPMWLNLDWNARVPGGPYGNERWAVAIHPDARTETLAAAHGERAPVVTPPRLVQASTPP